MTLDLDARAKLRQFAGLTTLTVASTDILALLDALSSLEAEHARLREERDEARKVADVRQRMIDIPTAWELTLATPQDQHHERCSYRTANMLCDCAACRVMERVSGLLGAANTRAERAEAERDALAARVKALEARQACPCAGCAAIREAGGQP